MKVTVHGCRGSIATASPDTQKYGDDTTCFELSFKGYLIVFDTGTEFQNLAFSGKGVTKLILYSHFHHDHIQGLVFHDGVFNQDHQVTFSTALMRGITCGPH
jgi:phosphoribosyl 1,2-cyclic phosphodiesterase